MIIKNGEFSGAPTLTLKNSAGMQITLYARGAGIMSIKVPDRDGAAREVTKMSSFGYGKEYHGLTIGRTSGRLDGAEFTIDGRTAKLDKNNFGVDCLHGGIKGLFTRLFGMNYSIAAEYTDVVFSYRSPDGECGYFGNVDITVTYRVFEQSNDYSIRFQAMPDCKTLLNMTNHAYFDMSGDGREPITEQTLYLNAEYVSKLDERLVVREKVKTPDEFDFTFGRLIGENINADCVRRGTCGYDHLFWLDENAGIDKAAAKLYSKLSGIELTVRTTYPCIAVFTDNFDGYRAACLECQYPPNGINTNPDACGVCSPDAPYDEVIMYSFATRKD